MAEPTPEQFLESEEVKNRVSPSKLRQWRDIAVRLSVPLAMTFLKKVWSEVIAYDK